MKYRRGDLLMNARGHCEGQGYVWKVEDIGPIQPGGDVLIQARAIRLLRGTPEPHDSWLNNRRLVPADWYQPFTGQVPPYQMELSV